MRRLFIPMPSYVVYVLKETGEWRKGEREMVVLLCKYINVTRNNSNCPPICELCENEKRQSFVIVDKCAILSTYQHYELIILMIIIIIIIKDNLNIGLKQKNENKRERIIKCPVNWKAVLINYTKPIKIFSSFLFIKNSSKDYHPSTQV